MGAYNCEGAFYVALHHLQANWPGMFNKVMNTTQDAQYVILHLRLNPRAHSLNNADSQLSDAYGAEAWKIQKLMGQNRPTTGRNQNETKNSAQNNCGS